MNRRIGNRIISLILVLLMGCSTVSGTGVTAFAETSDGNPPIESVDSATSPADSKAATKVLTYATDEENITDAYLGIALTGGTAFEEGSTLSCHVMDDQERASYTESLQSELDNDKTKTRQVSMVKAFDLGVSAPDHPVQKTFGAPVTVRMYLQNADALSDTALYVRDENQAWHEVPFEVHKSSDAKDGKNEAESKVAHGLPYIQCSADQLGTFAFAEVSETDISADESVAAQEPVHEAETYAYTDADARASNPVNNVYWWYDASKTTLHLSNKAKTVNYQLVRAGQPWSGYSGKITQVVLDTEIQPASTASWFNGCSALTNLDFGDRLNTVDVTDMNHMFSECYGLGSLDLGDKFDTGNVTDMECMFNKCYSLQTLDLGDKFNTGNVMTMKYMFSECYSLRSLDLGDKFDTRNVTDMECMFNKRYSLTSLNLGDKFDTRNVTNMNSMFNECHSLTSLDLGDKFDTSNVQTMESMFSGCSGLKKLNQLNFGDKFDTSNVQTMTSMFSGCTSLTSFDLGDKFDTSHVSGMGSMFSGCSGLKKLNQLNFGDKFDTSNVQFMDSMFSGCSGLKSLDLEFNTCRVWKMDSMFSGCSSLTSLDLGDKFDTINVEYMDSMFSGCSSLTSLDLEFNTTVKTLFMDSMFSGCSGLKSLHLGDMFDASEARTMDSMFSGCSSLKSLDLEFNTRYVWKMESMFSGCNSLTSLDLGDMFDTSDVRSMESMFSGCSSLTSLDLGDKFDTSRSESVRSMFSGCSSLINLDLGDKFDTSRVTSNMDMADMFKNCYALQRLVSQKSGRQDIELPRKMIEQDSQD